MLFLYVVEVACLVFIQNNFLTSLKCWYDLYCSVCWQVYSTSFTYYIYCLQKENIEPQKRRCSTRSGQQLEQPTTSRSTRRTRTVKQL